MYELCVLGQLMDQPMHGYLLHAIVRRSIGPLRQFSWGALYPLIRRLEEGGLIVPDDEASGPSVGSRRKVYRITAAGRERFMSLMLDVDDYDSDYLDVFHVKLTKFGYLDAEQQRAILVHYRGYVHYLRDALRTARRHVTAQPDVPELERPHIVRVLDHRLHLQEADAAWIEAAIAQSPFGPSSPAQPAGEGALGASEIASQCDRTSTVPGKTTRD